MQSSFRAASLVSAASCQVSDQVAKATDALRPAINKLDTESETESSPVCDKCNRAQESVHFDELELDQAGLLA